MIKKNISIHTFNKQKFLVSSILFCLIVISCVTILKIEFPKNGLKNAFAEFFNYVTKMFLNAKLSGTYSIKELLHSLIVSLSLAILTTLFGIVFAFFLGLAASENLSCKTVANCIRALTSFIRSVPTIIWVLIFSVVSDLGTEAAILGMSFHSTAYLVKVFSESFEQIDTHTIEALKACGASYIEIITQAVLPSSINSLIAWSFFRFEINFGNAIAVGAAAGAGGIGYELFIAGNLNFNISEVGFISYMIFTTAIILEFTSTRLRKKKLA